MDGHGERRATVLRVMPETGPPAIGRLIGDSRLSVLVAVRQPATNEQIAGRCHLSMPSVSRHTTVLRDAGLIASTRHGQQIVHALTQLGALLLCGVGG